MSSTVSPPPFPETVEFNRFPPSVDIRGLRLPSVVWRPGLLFRVFSARSGNREEQPTERTPEAEQQPHEDFDPDVVCSYCGSGAVVKSRPLSGHLIGRGVGPLRAFWRTCQICEAIPERRAPQPGQALRLRPVHQQPAPRDPWWNS